MTIDLIIKRNGETLHNQPIPVAVKKRIAVHVMTAYDQKYPSKSVSRPLFNSQNS